MRLPRLRPDASITQEDRARGRAAMVQDAAWASIVGATYSGVILIGFALQLGASPFTIGLIAAIPLLAQLGQVPAVALIERLRQRRKIAVLAVLAARVLIVFLMLLPWLPPETRVGALLALELAITVLGSFAGCSISSWFHQLLAGENLGALYARRLFWSTFLAACGALAAGQLIDHWTLSGERIDAYAVCFAVAGIAGLIGTRTLLRIPEPPMRDTGPALSLLPLLRLPLADTNFCRLMVFMACWNFSANLAAPFITVYLLQQQGYGLGLVTALWAISQTANAVTLFSWGRLSDRMSNKAILAAALPVYFGCLLALPLSTIPAQHLLTLPILWVIHLVMGMASGGIGLATGNIALKLAPPDRATAYLAAVSLGGALSAGCAALLGGALASWFAAQQLSLHVQWSSDAKNLSFPVLALSHWEFLFAIAATLGLYVMHALSRVQEGSEFSERIVIRNFAFETGQTLEQAMSTVASSLSGLFAVGRLFDRRRRQRDPS